MMPRSKPRPKPRYPRHKEPPSPYDRLEDNEDPVALLKKTSCDEIEQWLSDLAPAINTDDGVNIGTRWDGSAIVRSLFTDWERKFYTHVNEAYDLRMSKGFSHEPLTGKQLVILKRLWRRLSRHVQRTLEKTGGFNV